MTSGAYALHRGDDASRVDVEEIVGRSDVLQRALFVARRFAESQLPVLVLGPTGSGKELFAHAIHRWSGRPGPLVDINCGALPSELVEGELFGHRRGAFTGAVDDQGGLISAAEGGTLFLDELSSLPPASQVKLLRVLESGEVRRVGETRKRRVSFRLVSAAHPELRGRARDGAFRRDLFHRVAGVVIELSSLAERPGDIIELARHFAAGRERVLRPCAEPVLIGHSWPGNIRELRSVIDRAVMLSREGLTAEVVRQALALGGWGPGDPMTGRPAQGRYVQLVSWIDAGWDVAQMAMAAGVHRATVFRWLKAYGLSCRGRASNGSQFM